MQTGIPLAAHALGTVLQVADAAFSAFSLSLITSSLEFSSFNRVPHCPCASTGHRLVNNTSIQLETNTVGKDLRRPIFVEKDGRRYE